MNRPNPWHSQSSTTPGSRSPNLQASPSPHPTGWTPWNQASGVTLVGLTPDPDGNSNIPIGTQHSSNLHSQSPAGRRVEAPTTSLNDVMQIITETVQDLVSSNGKSMEVLSVVTDVSNAISAALPNHKDFGKLFNNLSDSWECAKVSQDDLDVMSESIKALHTFAEGLRRVIDPDFHETRRFMSKVMVQNGITHDKVEDLLARAGKAETDSGQTKDTLNEILTSLGTLRSELEEARTDATRAKSEELTTCMSQFNTVKIELDEAQSDIRRMKAEIDIVVSERSEALQKLQTVTYERDALGEDAEKLRNQLSQYKDRAASEGVDAKIS